MNNVVAIKLEVIRKFNLYIFKPNIAKAVGADVAEIREFTLFYRFVKAWYMSWSSGARTR